MCNIAADYYEEFFKESKIVRPHPYTDSPPVEFDNEGENIPEVTQDKLLASIHNKRKKRNPSMHMACRISCSTFLILIIGH